MEKLANHIALQSIAEGGMEKQALDVAQLLRMGRTFALRGKMDRFNKLLDRRSNAISSSFADRRRAMEEAESAYRRSKDYLFDEEVNPALAKRELTRKRLPRSPIWISQPAKFHPLEDVEADARNDLADLLAQPTNIRNATLSIPPSYDAERLATFSRVLKQLDPELHKKVLTTGSF